MKLNSLSRENKLIFIWTVIPYNILLILLLFGWPVLNVPIEFAKAYVYIVIYYYFVFAAYTYIAIAVRNYYSALNLLFKRIAVMLAAFYLLNLLVVYGLYQLFNLVPLIKASVKFNLFWWAYLYSCVSSTAVTLLTEGVGNLGKWKTSVKEIERLRNNYKESRILGLQGQINSHFLFNCFNTLSELIEEDEKKAELFLEEMTNVHRHLLKSGTEYLISIEEEMQFVTSYLYLTKVRFGSALEFEIQIDNTYSEKMIPPLSMHVILENIIYTNAIDKRDPLLIHIESKASSLYITHTKHKRIITQSYNINEGLDNLITKYELLNAPSITIEETAEKRTIMLPMLTAKLTMV